MSKIHFLPVKYGDSFVIECDRGGNHGVVVVDGGPNGCGSILKAKLDEVGTPDLMLLTHYDDDHIGGLIQYIKACKKENKLPAREVWANCAKYAGTEDKPEEGSVGSLMSKLTRSAVQAVKLGLLLDTIGEDGGLTWRDDLVEGVAREFPFASVEVVSPTERGRELAIGKQEKVMPTVDIAKVTRSLDPRAEAAVPSLETLAEDCPKPPSEKADAEVANAASIAIILRCDGLSILMLGDCYPHNVVDYLRRKGYSEQHPLRVDYVKVAHHGSLHNTSNELMDLIHCNHYIISTNGDNFGHPDREAFAHILCHPTRDRSEKVHFYFNYDLDTLVRKSGRFLLPTELEPYNFEVHDSVSELPLAGLEPVPEPVEGPAPEPVAEPVVEPVPELVEGPAPVPAPKKKRKCFLRRLFSGIQVSVDFQPKKD